jgi:hypothetical protein
MTDSLGGEFPSTIRAIALALNRGGRQPSSDWSNAPPTLKLIAAALFTSHQIHVDFLHGSGGYVHHAQVFLGSRHRGKAWEEVVLYEKRMLLHRMSRMAKPKSATVTEVVRFAQVMPLTDIDAERERLLGLISSATELGYRAVALGAAGGWLEDQLMGFAMAALRKYDLTAGCRWMRSALYLGLGGDRLKACFDFLLLHQRPEGPFGYYDDTGQRSVVRLPKTELPFYTGKSIHLPVTVECLWTLAEVSTPWRLSAAITKPTT